MTQHSVHHATFTVARHYGASPARVFAAFADPVVKRRWFIEGEGWTIDEFTPAFMEGGSERSRFRFGDGPPMRNETVYHEIVPDERILLSYAMIIDGKRISVSLATITLSPASAGTKLVYTEQSAFLDGADQAAEREAGMRDLLETLAAELDRQSAAAA